MLPLGVVQKMMLGLPFDNFLTWRLVCKAWDGVSRECGAQWLMWLEMYGPREGWELYDHKFAGYYHCDKPEGVCRKPTHYGFRRHLPKLLKTMPLCDQVFRWGAERQLRRHQRMANDSQFRLKEAEIHYQRSQLACANNTAMLQRTEFWVDKLATRLTNRKRKRIMLSNLV